MITLTLASPAQTRRLARVLAGLLSAPALITVEGELGTGKTTLVRAILRVRGVHGEITSPSFTLAQSYHGREGEELHHLDLYRLSRGADAELFAWDDYLGPRALTFVEWPAAGSEALPAADVRIELEHRTPRSRVARVTGPPQLEAAVAAGAAGDGIAVAGCGEGREHGAGGAAGPAAGSAGGSAAAGSAAGSAANSDVRAAADEGSR